MRSRDQSPLVYLIPTIVGGYLVSYYFLGERVPYNGGLGFDGNLYGRLAADFPRVLAQKIPDYYIDRVLPSLVVWLGAKALGVELSTSAQILNAFHIYNSILLTAAALAWVRIARVMNLTAEIAFIGAACLFLNWLVSKQYLYFVVQTDATALSLGVLAALCAIERRFFSLAMVAFAASFAFKVIMPMALLLIAFPTPAADRSSTSIDTWIALACSVFAGAIAVYAAVLSGFTPLGGADRVYPSTLPLSVGILMAYVYLVARSFSLRRLLPRYGFENVLPIVFFIVLWALREAGLAVMLSYFGNGSTVVDVRTFLVGVVVSAVAKPGVFLVAHVVTFGPGIILLLWHLRRVMDTAAAHSLGGVLLVMAALALALDSESRVLAFVYPLLIVFLCLALQKTGVDRRFTLAFLFCSFMVSRWYLPLNALGMDAVGPAPMTDMRPLLQFPWQWLLMNVGPYMGWIGYAANLALVLAVTAVLISAGLKTAGAMARPRKFDPA